eukprot:g28532.t1
MISITDPRVQTTSLYCLKMRGTFEATAEFGAGPPSPVHVPILVDHLQSTLECGGLALGRGTWANAYRSAPHGSRRRQALKMLCELGIVTEKELADDLTVISDEHIEECVSIGLTMLQRWPNHAPPPLEAKERTTSRLRKKSKLSRQMAATKAPADLASFKKVKGAEKLNESKEPRTKPRSPTKASRYAQGIWH